MVTATRLDTDTPPWYVQGTYGRDGDHVKILYRGEWVTEPLRDIAWRKRHLHHRDGRLAI